MKKTLALLTIGFVFVSASLLQAFQFSFTEQMPLSGSSYGATEFGDYDNDGDLDLLVIGEEDIGSRVGLIYINTESGFNSTTTAVLPHALRIADAKWGDYDNDGDLDILVTGQSGGRLTTILQNNDGTFVEKDFGMLNMEDGAVDWGDYDNDGDLDVAVTGRDININRPVKIYYNTDTGFEESGISLDGIESGDLEWVDYDVDGDLDLFVTGNDAGRKAILYRQDPEGFVDSGFSFENVTNAASDWGDYDQDGDLDLILCGNNLGQFSAIYRNDLTSFTQTSFPIMGMEKADVKWADFDNDGDLDFIISGTSAISDTMLIYENTGTSFLAEDLGYLPGLKNSSIAVGDFDRDADTDFVISGWNSSGNRYTLVFKNDENEQKNSAPLPPSTTDYTILGDGQSVWLSWGAGTDNETDAAGLTYNLRIGTTENGQEILSAHNAANGRYKLARRGNMESRLSYTVHGLEPGTYYWGIQSVDNNYEGGNVQSQSFTLTSAPSFTEIDVSMPGFQNGEMAWGDYDNDGDLDLAVTGFDNDASTLKSVIMTNNGDDTFSNLNAGLQNASGGSVDWGDFDRDGDLDLLLSGYLQETLIYRNNNSNFVKIDAGLPGFNNGDALWVDYDNDGDLDIHLAPKGEIYENNENNFAIDTLASQNLNIVSDADAAWGDYDNDGDKDLIVLGNTGQYYGYLYRNDGGVFVDWSFDFDVTSDGQGFGHPNNGMALADIDWADYDNDGDLDFIISGQGRSNTADIIRMTVMYKNQGPDLNNDGLWLFEQTETSRFESQRIYEGVNRGSVDWGDFNHSGNRDFLVSGSQGSTINASDYLTMIYANVGTDTFSAESAANANLRGMGNSAVAVADYDNDGDLDFMQFGYSGTSGGLGYATRLYKNTLTGVENLVPDAPENLRFTMAGDTIILQWDPTSDDLTPVQGLTYNVRVGTSPNSENIVPAHAELTTGKLKKVFRGNSESARQYKITGLLQNQTYYWSVQAIDAGYKASAFASEASFNTFTSAINVISPNGDEELIAGEPFNITWSSNDITNVRIDFSTNLGATWEMITNSTPADDGMFSWTVPATLSDQVLIRVSDESNSSVFDVSDNTFKIIRRFIEVIHPNGGEIFKTDSTYNVDYFTPYQSDFRIEYSTNGGTDWTQIGVQNDSFDEQSIEWIVPDVNSVNCLVRVSDLVNTDVRDTSDNVFTITQGSTGPNITVTQPNGGENWQVGTTKNITWNTNSEADLTIDYSTDGGSSWTTISTSVVPASGSFAWFIPQEPSNDCLVRISETGNPGVADVSDSPFSIVSVDQPYVNILYPVGAEFWEIGSTRSISWESNNVANIKIELSVNGGASYQTIEEAVTSTPASYDWVIVNVASDECLFRLSDSENPATSSVSANFFSIGDTTKPVIEIDDPTEDQPIGMATTVAAVVFDNSSVSAVNLHYKQGHQLNFSQVEMTIDSNDRYTAEIPAFVVGETGVTYFVDAFDEYNNQGKSQNFSIGVVLSQGLNNPVVPPAGSDITNYRLFSIPVELDNPSPANFITNNTDLGNYDDERFRWYAFNNNTQQLNEYPDISNLTPGLGYFFITRDDITMNSGLGQTVDVSQPYKISVQAGWSLIGNPFNFTIDSVYTIPKVEARIWKYEGDWQLNGKMLEPWKGYALNVSSAADIYFVPKSSTGKLNKSIYTSHINNNDEWLIRIKAQDGSSVSSFNFAGQLNDASDMSDKYDLKIPPRLPGQLSVAIQGKDDQQAADIRSENDAGHTWDFICYTNPESEKLSLNFSGLDHFSDEYDVFLIDKALHVSYNLKNENALEFVSRDQDQKEFVLVVGTKEYLTSLELGAELYPSVFELKPVFPNPFNPVTQLNFSIDKNVKVRLDVYNVLGQLVSTIINQDLAAGTYNAVWDAGSMSSGIYIFKLIAGNKNKIRRGLLIK